ncbi:hypothetical protein [Kribbella sp. NPDC048915]|uniref:hypothetical protein n=1 Tax=Kribbella sp. NPDC048915 TaxID=3155148 RepID=UPI0033CD43D9
MIPSAEELARYTLERQHPITRRWQRSRASGTASTTPGTSACGVQRPASTARSRIAGSSRHRSASCARTTYRPASR